MSLLEIDRVSRNFGSIAALRELQLAVSAGERVALLGHNGAGKTTLFRLILGFIKPDHGSLHVGGHLPGSRGARQSVAYLPESVAFPRTLTGRETIRFYARLKGVAINTAEAMLERVGLAAAADRRAGTYSKGMRQRLGLAQALIGQPALLLLDEPTSGLDPLSRQQFYQLIDEAAAQGTAILLSSHSLTELEARTDRIAIMYQGRLIADGSLSTLRSAAHLPVHIRVQTDPLHSDRVAEALGGQRVNGRSIQMSCPASEKLALLERIRRIGPLVEDIDMTPPTLADIYDHFCSQGSRNGQSNNAPGANP